MKEKIGAVIRGVGLGLWTGVVMLGVQVVLSIVMTVILQERVEQPLWRTIYSVLADALGFVVLWRVTPKLEDWWGRWWRKMRDRAKGGEEGTSEVTGGGGAAGRGKNGRAEAVEAVGRDGGGGMKATMTARRTEKKARAEQAMEARGELRETEVKHHAATREELGLRGLPTWTDLGLGVIGLIVAVILAGVLLMVFQGLPWFNAEETQELGYSTLLTGFDRLLAFLALAVVAPVAEELIFRGWLYGQLREHLGKKLPKAAAIVVSTLITSLVFAALHGQWNVGVVVFALSVVMCGLREITGTIYAGLVAHILKNVVAFYMLYVIGV